MSEEAGLSESTVRTSAGPLMGRRVDDVVEFLGIPYGAPPIGNLRFRPPTPALPWSDTRVAIEFGSAAHPTMASEAERLYFRRSIAWRDYAGYTSETRFDEDCLSLNVWTPDPDDAARPALVWFHGGGFKWGSGAALSARGTDLAANHDIVVVTVNHRLGILGHAYDEVADPTWTDSSEVGLLDLRLALQWIRENISAFGGDPSRVTIAGHSGGALKVACALASPAFRGLFHRAAMLSPVRTQANDPDESLRFMHYVMARAGYPGRSDLHALRDIRADRLSLLATGTYLRPTSPSTTLPEQPFSLKSATNLQEMPVLVGAAHNDLSAFEFDADPYLAKLDDWALFERVRAIPGVRNFDHAIDLVRQRIRSDGPVSRRWILAELSTQALWDRITDLVRCRARVAAPTYVFDFRRRVPMPAETAFEGDDSSYHGAEVPYLFNRRTTASGLDGADAGELAMRMSSYFTNFARSGNPNGCALPHWPEATTDITTWMQFE